MPTSNEVPFYLMIMPIPVVTGTAVVSAVTATSASESPVVTPHGSIVVEVPTATSESEAMDPEIVVPGLVGAGAANDQVLVLSLKTNAWTRYAGIRASAVCKRKNGELLSGSAIDDGMVYKLFKGSSDDEAEIEAYAVTADIPFREMGAESRIRKVALVADSGTDDQEIAISYSSDRFYNYTSATAMSLEASGDNKWDEGEWNEAVWEGPQLIRHTFVPNANSANQFRLRLDHQSTEPLTFYGLTVLERERRVRP